MAELPKGVRLASGYLVERGGVVTGRCFRSIQGLASGDFEFKDAFH